MRLPSKPPFPLLFQSTLPARGATAWTQNCRWPANFNPRSLHGERRRRTRPEGFCPRISIHAPCTGSDVRAGVLAQSVRDFNPRSLHGERHLYLSKRDWLKTFQSTLPARGATNPSALFGYEIEAFQSTLPARGATPRGDERGGGMAFQSTLPARGATTPPDDGPAARADFNPRSLHGERLDFPTFADRQQLFQSTLPARGATGYTHEND